MAVGKNLQKAGRTVKSAAKKVVKAVDRAVVEPVAGLFRSDEEKGKGKKGTARKSTARKTAAKPKAKGKTTSKAGASRAKSSKK